jgi:uncharacterized membrane protein
MSRDDKPSRDYWPPASPFIVVLAAITILVLALVFLNVISFAYERIGLSRGWLFAALFGSIIGSWFDIPVARFPDRTETVDRDVVAFGVRYRVPTVTHTGTTTLAVNVGGALIPSALAGYLVVHDHIWLRALIAVAVVSVLVFLMARPVRGVGIVCPTLVPPIVAALAAIVIGGHHIAAVAYVGGTIGTLLGADLFNLGRIRDLGAPVASIGGAGTFDGVFLTGILAVLLASL